MTVLFLPGLLWVVPCFSTVRQILFYVFHCLQNFVDVESCLRRSN